MVLSNFDLIFLSIVFLLKILLIELYLLFEILFLCLFFHHIFLFVFPMTFQYFPMLFHVFLLFLINRTFSVINFLLRSIVYLLHFRLLHRQVILLLFHKSNKMVSSL